MSAEERPTEAEATAEEAPVPSESRGPAGPKARAALTGLIVIYALILAALTVDQVLNLGLYPSKLDRRVNGFLEKLGSPDEATRRAAATELERGEAFVVIPALIKALDAPGAEVRGEAANLLRSLTTEYLNGDLMGFRADASLEERQQARRKLWQWWERVREDF